MKTITSRSARETRRIASGFAKTLVGGEIINLTGPLGAGKTEFTKGLAQGLGIRRPIKSPTFVLEKLYSFSRNRKKYQLRHLDLYRTAGKADLADLELNRKPPDSIVTVVEWPERAAPSKYKNVHIINFRLGKTLNERILTFNNTKSKTRN